MPWPEPRLTYANAVLPEALIAIGRALNDDAVLAHGLDLLQWLLDLQTRDGHISVTPAAGLAPGDRLPGFHQQPIEVSALAEACWRAHEATGDPRWMDAVQLCAEWFLGANDVGLTLYDRATGGCSDGLHSTRINLNQGAESTLAALSTLQRARAPPSWPSGDRRAGLRRAGPGGAPAGWSRTGWARGPRSCCAPTQPGW